MAPTPPPVRWPPGSFGHVVARQVVWQRVSVRIFHTVALLNAGTLMWAIARLNVDSVGIALSICLLTQIAHVWAFSETEALKAIRAIWTDYVSEARRYARGYEAT